MGLGAEKVWGQVSKGSKVGGGHRALAHACQRAVAGHAVVRAPGHRLSILPLSLHTPHSSAPQHSKSLGPPEDSCTSISREISVNMLTCWTHWNSRRRVKIGEGGISAYQPAW